mmetsp:Transcript_62122/g.202747  ORF Transcript_62122/g.202747 Transcript_62122/m.202747 type:complete len:110 (-) Transcript_62122:607-936(-)
MVAAEAAHRQWQQNQQKQTAAELQPPQQAVGERHAPAAAPLAAQRERETNAAADARPVAELEQAGRERSDTHSDESSTEAEIRQIRRRIAELSQAVDQRRSVERVARVA